MRTTPFRPNFASTVCWINCFLDTSVVLSCWRKLLSVGLSLFFSFISVNTSVLSIATEKVGILLTTFFLNVPV